MSKGGQKKKLIYNRTYLRRIISENPVAGKTVEEIVFTLGKKHTGGNERRSASERAKRTITEHDKSALNRMNRLVNTNYSENDFFITPSYCDAELEKLEKTARRIQEKTLQMIMSEYEYDHYLYEAARRDVRNWLRRVKYHCDKAGIELRSISTTSDMDGETKETVRVHHHLIINAEAKELAIRLWRGGDIKATQLWKKEEQLNRLPLCRYMLDQVRHYTDERAYNASQTLRKPIIETIPVKRGYFAVPPRWAVPLYSNEYEIGKTYYLCYWVPPEAPEQNKGSKRRRE